MKSIADTRDERLKGRTAAEQQKTRPETSTPMMYDIGEAAKYKEKMQDGRRKTVLVNKKLVSEARRQKQAREHTMQGKKETEKERTKHDSKNRR